MVNEQPKLQTHSPLLPFLMVLICIALGYFIISPKIAEIKSTNTSIAAKDKDTQALQEKIDGLKSLKSKFAVAPDDVNLLKIVTSDSEQMPEIIEQITAIANKSGMLVKSIKPDSRQVAGETLLSLQLGGDYLGLISFSENLEKNVRPAGVKSINMSSGLSDNTKTFDATVTISLFTNNNSSAAKSTGQSNIAEEAL